MLSISLSPSEVLWIVSPFPAITSAGSLLESYSPKKNFTETAGKVIQLIPSTFLIHHFLKEKLTHAIYWRGISPPVPFSSADRSSEALSWWQSVGTREVRGAQADFWAPKIATTVSAILLLSPFIFKGLQAIAHKFKYLQLAIFLDRTEKIFMTMMKIVNIAAIAFGLILAIGAFNIPLIGLYSVFLLLHFYLFLRQIECQINHSIAHSNL